MWLFVLVPNIIWMLCIFYVLYQDKIEANKKILYLLVLNLLFMFSDFTLGKEFITDASIEFVPFIMEGMQFCIIMYWLHKQNHTSKPCTRNTQSKLLLGLCGLLISVLLIAGIYFFIL